MATTYTPKVWQNWPSTATLFAAPDANRWEQALADLYSQLSTLTPSTADQNQEFAPEAFGAKGDGTTDDRAAVQAAIDAATARYAATGGARQVVPITATYLLSAVDYIRTNGTTNGAVSLMLRDGVELAGQGILKVKSGAYGIGAFYAAIRSRDTGVTNAMLRDITIDGNKAGNRASTQCSNVLLEVKATVDVVNIRSVNANGNGIMVRGTTTAPMLDVRVRDCIVFDANSIGIQASQFDGLEIEGNTVARCANNCIDVYGEDGDTVSNGTNFRISNNRVRDGLVGIFLETVATGIVTGNFVRDCTAVGVIVNRINGQPREINIAANTLTGSSPTGVRVTGDTGGISIRNNLIAGVTTAGVQLGGGGGNVSSVSVLDNTIDSATVNTVPLVLIAGNQAAFNRIRGTVTRNTDRTKDTVVTATTVVNNPISPANAA